MDNKALAAMIDHTNLKPTASREDIEKLCAEAREYGFASVCVNPCHVRTCAALLRGSAVAVCTVVGFPLGQNTVETKLFEAKNAIDNGASEIDYVLNISKLLDGELSYIRREMEMLTELCRSRGAKCKVILETCYLAPIHIEAVCHTAARVGIDFVKTSTGFGPAGARAEDVALMKAECGPAVKVKAAGGIRTRKAALELIAAGADRLGCSAGVQILREE